MGRERLAFSDFEDTATRFAKAVVNYEERPSKLEVNKERWLHAIRGMKGMSLWLSKRTVGLV